MYESLPGELLDKADNYTVQQTSFKRQWDILTEFHNILRTAEDREPEGSFRRQLALVTHTLSFTAQV